MCFYTFCSMNPNELALIRFLAASLDFMSLHPYTLQRMCAVRGGEDFRFSYRRRNMGEESTLPGFKLSFLNDYFAVFSLRYFSKWLKIHIVKTSFWVFSELPVITMHRIWTNTGSCSTQAPCCPSTWNLPTFCIAKGFRLWCQWMTLWKG